MVGVLHPRLHLLFIKYQLENPEQFVVCCTSFLQMTFKLIYINIYRVYAIGKNRLMTYGNRFSTKLIVPSVYVSFVAQKKLTR